MMKAKFFTLIGTVLMASSSNVALAQSGTTAAQLQLSPQAQELLCKNFPLNSRCANSTQPTASSPSMTTAPSSTTPEPSAAPSDTTKPITTSPNTTTPPGSDPNSPTTVPGSTTPPVGAPSSPGSQTRPYVTPQ